MKKILFACFAFVLSQLLFTEVAIADDRMKLGHIDTLQSKILAEKREVFIHLPRTYDNTSHINYPLLITLDGDTHFVRTVGTMQWLSNYSGLLPEHIVVSIPNVDRFRDLSPTRIEMKGDRENVSGGGDRFLDFIEKELIPHLDSTYRTLPQRTLVGHSFGGLFTIHAMLERPNLFQGYIAMSPHLLYDDFELLSRLEKNLAKQKQHAAFLFTTLGTEPNRTDSFNRLISGLEKFSPKNIQWKSAIYPDENHMSTPVKTLHEGLLAMRTFMGWKLEPEIVEKGPKAAKAFYQSRSKQLGFQLKPFESVINSLGYQFLNQNKYSEAVAWLEHNVSLYPDSANANDSLAEALERSGNAANALTYQKKALMLAQKNKSSGIDYMTQRVAHLQSLVDAQSLQNQ